MKSELLRPEFGWTCLLAAENPSIANVALKPVIRRRLWLFACQQFEPTRRLRRSELFGFLVPDPCHGHVRYEAMHAKFRQNHGIVGSSEPHGGLRISGVCRAPQHEASRGEVAARNQ